MVLSGMSNMEQMNDNISFMKDFQPLTEKEMGAIQKVQEIFKSLNLIPCTGCEYCMAGCPKESKASDCIKCGKCEEACPQHLKIRDLLSAADKFEN